MKKNQRSKSAKPQGLLGGARKALKKLGNASGLRRLSPAQKVIGGGTLLALGLRYLAKRRDRLSASTAEAPTPTRRGPANRGTR